MSERGPSPYPLYEQDVAYLAYDRVEWDPMYLRAAWLRLNEALTKEMERNADLAAALTTLCAGIR